MAVEWGGSFRRKKKKCKRFYDISSKIFSVSRRSSLPRDEVSLRPSEKLFPPRSALNLDHKYFPRIFDAERFTRSEVGWAKRSAAHRAAWGNTNAQRWAALRLTHPTASLLLRVARPETPRALIPNPSPEGRREKQTLSLRELSLQHIFL
jgi:hypothetical protein